MDKPLETAVAVIVCCFNRREQTLGCLQAVQNQCLRSDYRITIYLLDDGSTDGTSEAVSCDFPSVNILSGSGALYWNGGMRVAFEAAIKHKFDFYLWMNDDTKITVDALEKLLATFDEKNQISEKPPIVVGATSNESGSKTTYGGVNRSSWYKPVSYRLIGADSKAIECDSMNGNCVLIPSDVVSSIGNLDPAFQHYMGDHDYGHRAQKAGHPIWLAPGFVGVCEASNVSRRDVKWKTFKQGLAELRTPKGLVTSDADLPSFAEWKVYCKRHAGPFWFVYWLLPYRRLLKMLVLGKA